MTGQVRRLVQCGIVGSGLAGGGAWLAAADTTNDRFTAVFVVVGAILSTLIAVEVLVPRRPDLVVAYRNPHAGGQPVVWPRIAGVYAGTDAVLLVQVANRGSAPARAVEVRFDTLGVKVLNESGNNPSDHLDITVNPPRFLAGERILNPGQTWTVAQLSRQSYTRDGRPWNADHSTWTSVAEWTASAEGIGERAGTVTVEVRDAPPPAR